MGARALQLQLPLGPQPRVLSYGGGLDSFALLLRAIQLGERLDVVAFVDVADPEHKDPGEWPGTYQHIREVVQPLCALRGIEFVWLDSKRWPVRNARSLFAWLKARKQIPVAGPNRVCTNIAKVERFEAWLASRFPGRQVEVWLGFEAGEEARAAKDPNAGKSSQRVNRFPLIEWSLCRCRCEALVRDAGLAIPRKSACVFCPYGSRGDWQTFAAELPQQFAQVVKLERDKPRTSKGKKLSIMGYRTLKDATGKPTGEYRAPPLPEWIKGTYRAQPKPCAVCGALQRASKATGCDFLPTPARGP